MRLCECRSPARSAIDRDRLRCSSCSHWTPHGRVLSMPRLEALMKDARSLLANVEEQLPWELSPHRPGAAPGVRSSAPSDPTGSQAVDTAASQIGAYRALSGRLLERALVHLRQADEAVGEALFIAEGRPGERDEGEWWPQLTSQADLAEAKAAQERRMASGNGWGSG